MLFRLLFFFSFLFVIPPEPEVQVKWLKPDSHNLQISVSAQSEVLEHCLSSGLEVRYRYELQFCRHREGWFNACKDVRKVIQSVQFDPIAQTYTVYRDRHGDDLPREELSPGTKEEALDLVTSIKDMPLEYLSRGDTNYENSPKAYLGVKVAADCRGEYSETLARIGYFLTLGLVNVSAFNTGWSYFDIASRELK